MANEAAPKTRRKSTGPRQQRPVFGIVTYTDADGTPVQLDKERLNVSIERDSAKIVEMLTSGGDFGSATVIRINLPQPQKRAVAGEAASA